MLVGTTPYAVLGRLAGWVALSIIALVALREAAATAEANRIVGQRWNSRRSSDASRWTPGSKA